MSADYWGKCPKCAIVANKKEAKRQRKLKILEEKITRPEAREEERTEYLALLNQLPTSLRETLREDYEIYTAVNGMFTVMYECECTECGFLFAYSDERETL